MKGCVLYLLFSRKSFLVNCMSDSAKKRLLKIPLAFVQVGEPSEGISQLYLIEAVQGANYESIRQMLQIDLR